MITEVKRNAIKAVLERVFDGIMDTGTALAIIEGIVEYNPSDQWWVQYKTTCEQNDTLMVLHEAQKQ